MVAQTRISAKLNRAPAAINTLTDIKEVFDAEAKERDFLIEEVGLSTNEYLEVKHRQLELHKQLTLSSQVHPLDTVHAERDRQILVKNHIRWMNRAIGRENYEQLQRITQLREAHR